jgi:hypothetical protein
MALHTYTPTEWKNAPDHKTTPINATNLNNIETGIENAYSDILEVRDDFTNIVETGASASQTISKGTYFYLEGTLVRAKVDIASGATFTLNTNYEVVTAGALNQGKTYRTYRGTVTFVTGNGGFSAPGWKVGNGICLTIEGTSGAYFVALRTAWSTDGQPTFNVRQPNSEPYSGTLDVTVIYEV